MDSIKSRFQYHPLKQLLITNNKLNYYSKKGSLVIARQQLTDVYYRNSAAYVVNADFLRKKKKIIGKNSGAYIINNKQISIDTIKDINEVKKLYEK